MKYNLFCLVLLVGCQKHDTPKVRKSKWPTTFQTAKAIAEREIYKDQRVTFYCGCAYSKEGLIDPVSCGYKPRQSKTRGQRMEWEHVIPAAQFGSHRPCWKGCDGLKGRMCCRKTDATFRKIEADLMNLVPSVGELNGDRSSRPYGGVEGEPRRYGACDFEVDFNKDVAEPRESIRGDIARIYKDMMQRHPGQIIVTPEQQQLFDQWDQQDPPSAEEGARVNKIRALMKGVRNEYCTNAKPR